MDSSELMWLFINNFDTIYHKYPRIASRVLVTTFMACMVNISDEDREFVILATGKVMSRIGEEVFQDVGDLVSYLMKKIEEAEFGQGV